MVLLDRWSLKQVSLYFKCLIYGQHATRAEGELSSQLVTSVSGTDSTSTSIRGGYTQESQKSTTSPQYKLDNYPRDHSLHKSNPHEWQGSDTTQELVTQKGICKNHYKVQLPQ